MIFNEEVAVIIKNIRYYLITNSICKGYINVRVIDYRN